MAVAAGSHRFRRLAGRPAATRVGAAAVAAAIVAEFAVRLLRPRGAILDPAPVSEHDYFSQAQLDRAAEFRDGQRLIAIAAMVVDGAVLALLAAWRPAPLRKALGRATRRPLLGAAAVGGGITLTLTVTGLPLRIAGHQRARQVGLSTQGIGSWLADVGKSAAIGVGLAALAAAVAVTMLRRLGRNWWIGASALGVLFAAVFTWVAPVLLAPLFNRFKELPAGRTRSELLRLGRQAGVRIGHVYEVDASRRSTGINAYVDGLGPTKRVVIYDNTLRDLRPAELRSVIAHELAHVKGNDVVRGIAWMALVAPLGALFVQVAGEELTARSGDDPRSPAALPALALAMAAATFMLGIVASQLSRRVESRADTFALQVTQDPGSFIGLQRQLAVTNVAQPRPPAALQRLFATHPDTMQRIGAAVTAEREQQR